MLNRRMKLTVLVLCIILIVGMIGFAEYKPFKVKLNLFERIVVMSLLPKEGSFITLKIIRDLQMELAPTEEEAALSGLVDLETGGIKAENWFAVKEKEIVFGDIAKGLVVDALKKLDDEEKLRDEHFSLYEKFIILPEKEGD